MERKRNEHGACLDAPPIEISNHANPKRKPRVLITHQGCVPIYRRPFFERLARAPDIDYVVAVGDAPSGTDYMVAQPPFAFETLAIRNYEFRLGRKSLIWQKLAGAYWQDFDAVVLGEELKYVSVARTRGGVTRHCVLQAIRR